MLLHEYVGNLHNHTPYSDGTAYHEEIAAAAQSAGLDFVVVTDHNIYLSGLDGYYDKVLLICGEEVHDRARQPQVNHLLVYNVGCEMAQYATDPQNLINEVNKARGLAFIAHPCDGNIPWMSPDSDGIAIPWVDWDVKGYHGLEIWNYMADWKHTMQRFKSGLRSFFRPDETVSGPRRETLALWDALLAEGGHVTGIGNADAHGTVFHFGPFKHTLYPYDFLFNCVNTHILTPTPFSGDAQFDSPLIFEALRAGRAYIGYDLPGDTRGFRFNAQADDGQAEMGDSIQLGAGVTLQTKLPARAHIKLIRHGEVVAENESADALVYTARQPGAYRVEVWRRYKKQLRCWILSNPIYVRPQR